MSTVNLTPEILQEIESVIKSNRFVQKRVEILKKKGFIIGTRRMGAGGVGKVKRLEEEVRVQISAGFGRYNYAKCVIFNP